MSGSSLAKGRSESSSSWSRFAATRFGSELKRRVMSLFTGKKSREQSSENEKRLTTQLESVQADLRIARNSLQDVRVDRDFWKEHVEAKDTEIRRLRSLIIDAERRASLGESHLTAAATLLRNGLKKPEQESEVQMK